MTEKGKPFTPAQQDMQEMSRQMAEAWMAIAQSSADIAHAKRTLFMAYVAEGFSEQQALELVKSA